MGNVCKNGLKGQSCFVGKLQYKWQICVLWGKHLFREQWYHSLYCFLNEYTFIHRFLVPQRIFWWLRYLYFCWHIFDITSPAFSDLLDKCLCCLLNWTFTAQNYCLPRDMMLFESICDQSITWTKLVMNRLHTRLSCVPHMTHRRSEFCCSHLGDINVKVNFTPDFGIKNEICLKFQLLSSTLLFQALSCWICNGHSLSLPIYLSLHRICS